jgi:hypothetical protein
MNFLSLQIENQSLKKLQQQTTQLAGDDEDLQYSPN